MRAAQDGNDPLRRLRQSAERLRTVESRLERGGNPDSSTSGLQTTQVNEAYDESRRLLLVVRQRLEDTRVRIEDARVVLNDPDENGVRTSAGQAQQGLDRTIDFATRLQQLASTLTDLSERASALAHSSSQPPDRSAVGDIRSAAALETPSSATNTDSIRTTVWQLLVASRRVSIAIDHHRAQQEAVSSSSLARSEAPPLPSTNVPLRVSLPSITSSRPTARTPSLTVEPSALRNDTSPNPDGLLLPSRPLTQSPSSLFTDHTNSATDQLGENYPGERAQLLRIASLQRDIASRASELRELRARGRELDREERLNRRMRMTIDQTVPLLSTDGDKEEDEAEESVSGGQRRTSPQDVAIESSGRPGAMTALQHSLAKEEQRKRYEIYSVCGR